jgi:hypothetical protein
MATIANRLTNTGTLLVNGTFDEVTFNTSSPTIVNLLTYTEQFNNLIWAKQSSLAVSANVTTAPDRSLTADYLYNGTTETGYISQNFNIVSGTTYCHSFYAKANTSSSVLILLYGTRFNNGGLNVAMQFNLSNGTVSTPGGGVAATYYGITSVGDGWYRCYIAQTATTTAIGGSDQPIRLGDSVLNNGIYAWGYQIEVGTSPSIYQGIAAANVLTNTSTSKVVSDAIYTSNIFDEVTFNTTSPTIKNLVPSYTNTMTAANGWSVGPNSTYVGLTTAPDGTATATTYTGNGSGGNEFIAKGITYAANTIYTASVYARLSSGTVPTNGTILTISYNNGTVETRSTVPYSGNLTSTWQRFSTTYTNIIAGTYSAFFAADQTNTANIDIWGAQVEQGSSATIYQPIAAANTLATPIPAQKKDSAGNMYVSNIFDEYTGAPVIDSSTKFWIDFGQSTSYPGTGTTVTDLSPSGLNMTLLTPAYYSFQQQGMKFTRTELAPKNGGGATVNTSGPMAVSSFLYNNHTWEVWFKIDDITSGNYDVTEGTSTLCLYSGYHAGFYYSSTTMSYTIWSTGPVGLQAASWTVGLTGAQINQGNWYQIVVTRTGNVFTPYINGVQLGTGSTTATTYPAGTTGDGLYIGKSQNVAPGQSLYLAYSKNTIDCVRMYTRALTADEVYQNFNALRRRYNI